VNWRTFPETLRATDAARLASDHCGCATSTGRESGPGASSRLIMRRIASDQQWPAMRPIGRRIILRRTT
jgi:hypothetical protein